MALSQHQANADPPAPVETPLEEIRETDSDHESEQYPEEDIPDEEEEEDDEEEEEDDDTDDREVKPPSSSVKLALDDSRVVLVSHCCLFRSLRRRRAKKRRMAMMRGRCRPTTQTRRASLMVSACMEVSDSQSSALSEVLNGKKSKLNLISLNANSKLITQVYS